MILRIQNIPIYIVNNVDTIFENSTNSNSNTDISMDTNTPILIVMLTLT